MWNAIKRFFGRLIGRKYGPVKTPEPAPPPPAQPTPVEPPQLPTTPDGVPTPKYRIDNLDEFGEWDRLRLERAAAILCNVFANPRTRTEWLTYKLKETNGLSNAQIWDLWVKGDQVSDEAEDALGVTDVKVILYNSRLSRVVGYTYLESLIVWVNRKFFSTDVGRASNLGHEAMGHQYGFTHTIADYESTVPWQVNRLVEWAYDEYGLEKVFPPL